MRNVYFFERTMRGRRYRLAGETVWDPALGRPHARHTVLGSADPAPIADLSATRTSGRLRIGDVGALAWVAEQLDVVGIVDAACGSARSTKSPSVGEMVLAVALQRTCSPGGKSRLSEFLDRNLPKTSCLRSAAFTGQAFHRMAATISDEQLEQAQIALARAAVQHFDLSTDVLAFDTTNFDTHIATKTPGDLARRGHAKSKRADLRVLGLAVLVSETGHVPLLYRTYPGNGSDQAALDACLGGLKDLHESLDEGEGRRSGGRTLVRDGGSWSEQLELDLDQAGYYTLISLPMSHGAAQIALDSAAKRGAMKPLKGSLREVRAARLTAQVGSLSRTLVVVESHELLEGQKRGIAAALKRARKELKALERRVRREGRAHPIKREPLERRLKKILGREHLSDFVMTEVAGSDEAPTFRWWVDSARRKRLEQTRLGKRVLCTDRNAWSTERIVTAFRGQWNVEELFRRAKKGGVAPWGPSYQRADASLRLHTFATVLGLTLVSLAKLALGTTRSARSTMQMLGEIEGTLVQTSTKSMGRRPTVLLAPTLTAEQTKAVRLFQLDRWMPSLLSSRPETGEPPEKQRAA